METIEVTSDVTPAPVAVEEVPVPAPVVVEEEVPAPAPVVVEEEVLAPAPAPVVVEEEVLAPAPAPAPVVVEEEVLAPAPAPVVVEEEVLAPAPAPVEKVSVPIIYPDFFANSSSPVVPIIQNSSFKRTFNLFGTPYTKRKSQLKMFF